MFKSFPYVDLATNPPSGTPAQGFLRLNIQHGRLAVTDSAGVEYSPTVKSGTPVNGVKASAVLTSNGTAPANGVTVTIGNKVYTFQTTLTNVDGNVLIGVSAAAALTNLKAAINKAAGGGTQYAAATVAHTQVAAGTLTATTLQVDALNAGAWANGIVTAETSVTLSWGGNLASGVSATVAKAGDELWDSSYRYIAIADVTDQSLTGWRRVAHSSF